MRGKDHHSWEVGKDKGNNHGKVLSWYFSRKTGDFSQSFQFLNLVKRTQEL
jgi:hypothetical protein